MPLLLLLACRPSVEAVRIVAPADGDTLRTGEPLVLSAEVDAVVRLDTLGFAWSVEPGGALTGVPEVGEDAVSMVPEERILPGVVTLRLVVSESNGKSAEDAVELAVLPNESPTVAFDWPTDGAQVAAGTALAVRATCADADEADLSVLTLAWQGVDAGDERCAADGTATATVTFAEPGGGRILVTVSDPSGEVGSALAAVEVVDGDGDDDGHADPYYGGDDCDDADAGVFPGAPEDCDGLDQDCDGDVDEDPAGGGWPDADGDGHGDPNGEVTCDGAPTDDDCDDADRYTWEGAPEVCDGHDNDCDGDVDEDVAGTPDWYDDADGDGWGDDTTAVATCSPDAGQVLDAGDCDDGDAGVYPGAPEHCDGADEDCDGSVDEVGAVDGTVWYRDADRDGHGVGSATVTACDAPAGYAANDDDCDDVAAATYPGAPEVCESGDDEDCDGDDPACRPTGTASLSGADARRTGVSANDFAGAVAWAGDWDGDGDDDVVVGAWGRSSQAGAAYLLEGPFTGDASLSGAAAAWTGAAAGDSAGTSVDGAGDVDGDGLDDVLVGAPAGGAEGRAYLLFGGAASGSLSAAGIVFSGEDTDDYAGTSVAGAGDVNADGKADVLVGAYGDDDGGSLAGAAYLWVGARAGARDLANATAKLVGEDADDYAGYAVGPAGDVDGDGHDDVIVGAPQANGTGKAYLLLGPVTGTVDLSAADARLSGRTSEDWMGGSVRGAGDTDGDGYDDVIVGAYQDDTAGSTAGAAYLFAGPLSGAVAATAADATFTGEDADDRAGGAVSGGGDVDGDGYADLLVGGWYEDAAGTGAGAAWLVYGPVSGTVGLAAADAKWTGESARDAAGKSVALGGDADGDGFGDVLIGATGQGSAASGAGAVYLVLGGGG